MASILIITIQAFPDGMFTEQMKHVIILDNVKVKVQGTERSWETSRGGRKL